MVAWVAVGVGSNINPQHHTKEGLDYLSAQLDTPYTSPFYQTPAIGFAGNDFINVGICGYTMLDYPTFCATLKTSERLLSEGVLTKRFTNRTIDLDLYTYIDLSKNEVIFISPDLENYAFAAQITLDLLQNTQYSTLISTPSLQQTVQDLATTQQLEILQQL